MDIRDTAVKYLAYRARTAKEVSKHLKQKGFGDQEIDQLIREFTELHYIDDEDYCMQYIRYAREKGRGPLRIRQELSEKGIDSHIIGLAMEECEDRDADMERAMKQAEKTIAGKPMDEKMKGRVGRRLVSLGYSMDIVYKVIGRYMREHDE